MAPTHGRSKGDVEFDSDPDDERPVAPDQFDPKYETSKWEIWAYYAYYIGNNGLTLFNFAPTAFQNLLYEAAGDSEVLHFAGRDRTINSIVLVSNGISFAIQIILFLVIGSYAGDHVTTSHEITSERYRFWTFSPEHPDCIIDCCFRNWVWMARCASSLAMACRCWDVHRRT